MSRKKSFLILILFFLSCTEGSDSINDVKKYEVIGSKVIINGDSNGNRLSQYLISDSDTTHTILYNNGEIIYNEGEYVIIETKLTDMENKEVKFSLYSVDIDSLRKAFTLYKSVDDYHYEMIAIEEVDSTFFTYTHQFKDSIVDIIARTSFGKGIETLFEKTTSPMIVNFNKGTVDIKPEYLEKMKDVIQVEKVPKK